MLGELENGWYADFVSMRGSMGVIFDGLVWLVF